MNLINKRYVELIYYTMKSQRSSKWQRIGMSQEFEDFSRLLPIFEREVARLEIYHGVLESAPQFIFHLYSLVTSKNSPMIVAAQTSSLALSLISISWALMSMEKGMRYMDFPQEPSLSFGGASVLFLSNFFRIISRFFALVLCSTVSKVHLLSLFVAHLAVTVVTGIWYFHIFLKELQDIKEQPLNSSSEIRLRDRTLRKMLSQMSVLGEPNSVNINFGSCSLFEF